VIGVALLALAAHPCIACHPKEVAGYAQSGMAQSLSRPANGPGGSFTHALSGSKFNIVRSGAGLRMRLERAGLSAEYPVVFAIGSGAQGHSYVVQIGDYLFQAPASYYASRRAWDVSPGYERDRSPDFDRPVTPECLFCHGTINPPAEAISCERCHGPSEAHRARPVASNIVNPVRLPPRARDSVCEQCHLSGEARVPNPGRTFQDFTPGRELEEVFSVYRKPAGDNFKVVSHAEQLALSRCARESGGRMWCGSCHNPHEKPASYRQRCLTCHGQALLAKHAAPADDCAGCHMPRYPSSDIAHASVTDHRILRRPRNTGETAPAAKLVAWREPAAVLVRRNLGLAYISVGERDQAAPLLNEGFRLLAGIEKESARDPDVLSALGLVLLRKGRTAEALRMFEQAARVEPSARNLLNLAVAQDGAASIRNLERAIDLDPSLERAYRLLAERQPQRRRELLERYLRFNPQSLSARQALQQVLPVR
jgi:hypothetical protein